MVEFTFESFTSNYVYKVLLRDIKKNGIIKYNSNLYVNIFKKFGDNI